MKTTDDRDRRVWAAMLFATGQRRCFCAVRGCSRLHWNFGDARLEAEAWAEEMGAGQVDWATLEGGIAAGRIQRARPRAAQHPASGGAAAGLLLSRCLERKSTIKMRILALVARWTGLGVNRQLLPCCVSDGA